MLNICIAKLKPNSPRLNGAIIGGSHADQLRASLDKMAAGQAALVVLDFEGIESASASYLKRLLNPFFEPAGTAAGFPQEMYPVVLHVDESDLREDLQDYLDGKGRVLIVADLKHGQPKFQELLGRLDRAAAQTFEELSELGKATAAELYERHRGATTNQTAWNNRLVQLVELRIARRNREGRFWIYEPTV